MTQLTKEMNKFDDMMNYLKRQLREVYSEAPKGCAVHVSAVADLGGIWEGLADTLLWRWSWSWSPRVVIQHV